MRIAVNFGDAVQGNGNLSDLIFIIAKQQLGHQFLLLLNEPLLGNEHFSNVAVEKFKSQPENLLKKRWKLEVQLPSILKKWKTDLLLNTDSSYSMKTKIPQIMYVHDLLFLHYPKQYSWTESVMRKFYFPNYFKKARSIIAPSEFVKQEIIIRFGVDAGKIHIVPKAVRSTFSPMNWEERNAVKDGYADGREYFLFVGGFDPVKNLMHALKAFSQFKKWQHSDMKLLVTGNTNINTEILQKIKTFRFRDDVVILGQVSYQQMSKLMAGAYALLYPSIYEGFGLPILESMQSGTPVITSNNSAMKETGGDAVLYVDANDESELSAQMIKLYKDEGLRERLIEAGKAHAKKYNQQSSVDTLWQVIESAVAN